MYIDGIDDHGMARLANMSTLVSQAPDIFEHTILFNITFGVGHDAERLENAIRISQLQPVIDRLPKGIHTDIRERGVNLSGGEQQRIALARGIYAAHDSSILLLDEPTSSIDPYHESRFYNELFAAFTDTCIICAVHGLHLLPRFDQIFVLQDGSVCESGTFSELVRESAVFQSLWKDHQSQLD